MAFDLGDLVELLQAEVDPPGTNSFPNATDDDWITRLRNAYWTIVLDGIIGADAYTDNDGVLVPDSAAVDLPRDMQQLVVFYAGVNVVTQAMRTVDTVFRTKAGPVEFETQKAASVLKAVMDELTRKRNLILNRLSDLGVVTDSYIDMVQQRDYSFRYADTFWTNY